MFEIRLDKQPTDFLKKCETVLYKRITGKLHALGDNPIPHEAKRVIGYEDPTFRLRVGKYRVLYRINYEAKSVIVVKIDHRENVY